MYVDAVTIAALVDELTESIVGGRVQAVIETGELSVGFEVYAHHQRHYLIISADPQTARCHLVPGKLRRGVDHSSPLGLLLRKYVDGAHLTAVTQPPWERVLMLDFSSAEGETRLIAEMMGKRSNIILTFEGEILDCIKRVGPDVNRYRVILPGKPYVPPPPQSKAIPEQVTSPMIEGFLQREADSPAWRVLVNNIAAVSPLLAREVIYFASGDPEAPAFDVAGGMIHAAFKGLLSDIEARRWTPCVVPTESGEGYYAFAAYTITCLGDCQPRESISAAMTTYFGAPVGVKAYAAAKSQVRKQIDGALERTHRKLASLTREVISEEEIELLRQKGELILAYSTALSPSQNQLQAQYDPDGPMLIIGLDPTLSPSENAQRYFEQYDKAKRAAADIPELQANVQREVAYLEQLATDLDLAESWPDIDTVREAVQEAGYWQGRKIRTPRSGKPGIRRFMIDDGFVILVGRNAAQNHMLVTERSAGDDLWLHARNMPGSHVIVKNDGRPIPESVIQRAAELAAFYSAGQDDTSVEVDITKRRYVRPIKGGRPGMVTYKNEQTIAVRPNKH